MPITPAPQQIHCFHSLFIKLFASVMLAVVIFTIALMGLTKLNQNSTDANHQALANQIAENLNTQHSVNTDMVSLPTSNVPANIEQLSDEQKQWIVDLGKQFHLKIALYNAKGDALVIKGHLPKQLPPQALHPPHWLAQVFNYKPKSLTVKHLYNGNILVLGENHPQKPRHELNLPIGLGLLLICISTALWLITTHFSRRLHRLSQHIDKFGAGDLSSRAPISGHDEIAKLSQGFNHAAQQIEDLIQANKLLLAHASHELRTPLTRIRLQVEMIRQLLLNTDEIDTVDGGALEKKNQDEKAQNNPAVNNHLTDEYKKNIFEKRETAIKNDIAELNQLVDRILLSSRLDSGEALKNTQIINLNQLIHAECQHYTDITVQLSPQTVEVTGQVDLLTQVVRNLINNAYLHGKPPVTISLIQTDKHNDNSNPEHSYASICVVDTGTIDPNKAKTLFEPFVRLNTNTKGSGLGLALVKQIVEAHQGTVTVLAQPKNTRFMVNLPLS